MRDWSNEELKDLYVITCTSWDDDDKYFTTKPKKEMLIPDYYYKIVCAYKDDKMMAFKASNSHPKNDAEEEQRIAEVYDMRSVDEVLNMINEDFDALYEFDKTGAFKNEVGNACR